MERIFKRFYWFYKKLTQEKNQKANNNYKYSYYYNLTYLHNKLFSKFRSYFVKHFYKCLISNKLQKVLLYHIIHFPLYC